MKTKGSTSYSGVPLKDLNKYFKEDAVIQVSKKFLDIHKLVSGDSGTHIKLSVDKEEEAVPGIVVKEADPEKLAKLSNEKPQEQAIVSKLESW
tara:strand:- start:112 stop:390 length:279 start_codon:yes stop_codon:yes gene_type:complete